MVDETYLPTKPQNVAAARRFVDEFWMEDCSLDRDAVVNHLSRGDPYLRDKANHGARRNLTSQMKAMSAFHDEHR